MALIKCPECGKENVSDSAEKCPECGYPIKKYLSKQKKTIEKRDSVNKIQRDKSESEDSSSVFWSKNLKPILLFTSIALLIIGALVLLSNRNNSLTRIDSEQTSNDEMSTTDINEVAEIDEIEEDYFETPEDIPFVSDSSEDEWNTQGFNDNPNNLHTLKSIRTSGENEFKDYGRVTRQGKWVYFYEDNALYKVNIDNWQPVFIANTPKVTYLNIIGDYLYYIEDGSSVCRMRTDGQMHETLFNDVEPISLFVTDKALTYVSKEQATGTTYNFILNIAQINYSHPSYKVNCGDEPPYVIYMKDRNVYFYTVMTEKYADYIIVEKAAYIEAARDWWLDQLFDGEVYDDSFFDSYRISPTAFFDHGKILALPAGAGYMSKTNIQDTSFNYIDISDSKVTQRSPQNNGWYPGIINIYNDKMISNSYRKVSIIDWSDIDVCDANKASTDYGSVIVKETEDIPEVYVYDDWDFILYTIANNSSGYNGRSVYKINIDGSGFMQLLQN